MRRLFLLVSLISCSVLANPGDDIFFHERQPHPATQVALTAGRYMYIGTVPRFASKDLTIFVSKMGLTTRVQAWVTPELIRNYSVVLADRFLKIAGALDSGKIRLLPLKAADQFENKASNIFDRLWFSVAKLYSDHVLAGQGMELYGDALDIPQRHEAVLTAIGRYYFDNVDLGLDSALSLAREIQNDPSRYHQVSATLFNRHFGGVFTRSSARGDGYAGYLTFVYPIAANANGPFSLPAEGVLKLGIPGSMEARWWSNKWDDDFGGFPFLMFRSDGVAFHGPISNRGPDVWYLRRTHASHGCMRMSASDIVELRALLPPDITHSRGTENTVDVVVTDWPDVADWDGDGEREVMDVGYYGFPTQVPPGVKEWERMLEYWQPDQARRRFYTTHYVPYNGRLPSGNFFDLSANRFFGLPLYSVLNGKLNVTGYSDSVALKVFPLKKQRILQYVEPGARLAGFDDRFGAYPPHYFNGR